MATPNLKFMPTKLRQQILLNLGYQLFYKDGASADDLPLPDVLKSEIQNVADQLRDWIAGIRNVEDQARLPDNSRTYRCFLSDVHWQPGTTTIDAKATAKMIIHCEIGLPKCSEFLLAAMNCLEAETALLWPQIDLRTRERWRSIESPPMHNPVLMYWIGKCDGQPRLVNAAIDRLVGYCVRERQFEKLAYFWPLVVQQNGGLTSEKTGKILDHAFHEAIECGNREAVHFFWYHASYEARASMISAAQCCGTRNGYLAFEKAVQFGFHDIVWFIWNHTTAEQHNGMLLASHANAFCIAAAQGHDAIAKMLWKETTSNQRFVLLYEQGCAAFRRSCANGHVAIVQLLWQDASSDERRQMLTICQNEALSSACRNGRAEVVEFLWRNMDGDFKTFLIDTVLSKCICEAAASVEGGPVLKFFFCGKPPAPTHEQLSRALMANEGAALTSLIERAEKHELWKETQILLTDFDQCLNQLRAMLPAGVLRQIGFDVSGEVTLAPQPPPPPQPAVSCIPKFQFERDSDTEGVEYALER